MKTLLGLLFEEFAVKIGVTPKKHYYSPKCETEFSVFVDGNEFLFAGEHLFVIKISNFSAASNIPGFEFPIETELDKFLATLTDKGICWEVFRKYSQDHWVVIKLLQHNLLHEKHDLLYEFEFTNDKFELQYIRFEGGLAALD